MGSNIRINYEVGWGRQGRVSSRHHISDHTHQNPAAKMTVAEEAGIGGYSCSRAECRSPAGTSRGKNRKTGCGGGGGDCGDGGGGGGGFLKRVQERVGDCWGFGNLKGK
ncbi:hypothetical protein Droror1_Dr00018830 [Drosera rotundifolia]